MTLLLPTDLKTVSTVVASHFGVTNKEINSKSHEERIVRVRQIIWFLLYKIAGATYSNIGNAFDKDCGTIRYGCLRIQDLIATDPKLAEVVNVLEERCRSLMERKAA